MLWATRPPSLFSQFQTLDVVDKGWLLSLHMICHPDTGDAEDEVMFDTTMAEGQGAWVVSQMIKEVVDLTGGV